MPATPVSRQKITGPISLLKQAWADYARRWKFFALIILIPIFASFLLGFTVSTLVAFQAPAYITALTGAIVVIGLIILQILTQIALITAAIDQSGATDLKTLFTGAWKNFWPFLGIISLSALASIGGLVLLVIPGIYISILLGFTAFALLVDNTRGMQALRQSMHVVSGYWWAVFGRMLFIGVIGAIPTQIATWIFGEASMATNVITVLTSLIVGPLSALYLTRIYRELKQIKQSPADTKSSTFLKAAIILGVVAIVGGIIFAFTILPKIATSPEMMNLIESADSLDEEELQNALDQALGTS